MAGLAFLDSAIKYDRGITDAGDTRVARKEALQGRCESSTTGMEPCLTVYLWPTRPARRMTTREAMTVSYGVVWKS